MRKASSQYTKSEKDERDAKMTYWLNQRRIERVAEAAARHGWYRFSAELMVGVLLRADNTFDYNEHTYRYEETDFAAEEIIARRTA